MDCHLDLLTMMVGGQPSDTFGGSRRTRALLAHIRRARAFVDRARVSTTPVEELHLAFRQVRTIERALARTTRNGETPPLLARDLANLVEQTIAEINRL